MIGADGAQLGIMSARDALNLAAEKNLDLVKIAPQATPPVCKIIDYGKYRFEQAKREKEAKKNQRVVEIKEIRLSLNIDTRLRDEKKSCDPFPQRRKQGQGFHPFPRQRDGSSGTGCRHHEAFRRIAR